MLRLNLNLFPKDGYLFVESDGARIVGKSWRGVVDRVKAYRKRAGLPAGNAEADVTAQACSRNPMHCSQASTTAVEQLRVTSLKGRVLAWVARLRRDLKGRDATFMSDVNAQARADICAKCPKNTALPDGCASCRVALGQLRESVIGPKRKVDGRLNACLVLGEDLATSVHLELQTVENDTLPDFCWRKRKAP